MKTGMNEITRGICRSVLVRLAALGAFSFVRVAWHRLVVGALGIIAIAGPAAAAALTVGMIAAATLSAQATPQQIVVAYGDLDLATPAGRTELTNRLEAAAGNLCSPVLARAPDSEPSVREHQILYRACVGRLSQRAMAGRN